MTRSKKVFLAIAAVFLIIVATIAYDFARRTKFPGQKPQKDTLNSAPVDSAASVRR